MTTLAVELAVVAAVDGAIEISARRTFSRIGLLCAEFPRHGDSATSITRRGDVALLDVVDAHGSFDRVSLDAAGTTCRAVVTLLRVTLLPARGPR
jgi:hypothetical protein